MGYRIDYQMDNMQRQNSRRAVMSGMFFLLFLIAVELFWPEGRNVIRGLLFSGDAEVAAEAMEELTVQLKLGMPVKDALVVFGRQILEGSSYAAN